MRVVVLFSGGLDSTTLVSYLLAEGHEVTCLGVHYGQRHARELVHARRIANTLEVPFELVSLPALGDLLPSTLTTGTGSKVVPNRNAVLVMVAVGYAQAHDCAAVALGINADDATDFYDCREDFVEALHTVAALNGVLLLTPFIGTRKQDVAMLGLHHGAPLELSRSCYRNDAQPCGTCDACHDRAAALAANAVPG